MYYFIINPHSRSGHGMEIWHKAEEHLRKNSVEYEAYLTEYPGHASQLAAQIAAFGIPAVLGVIGGDGTLNEVINGLANVEFSHLTLGYIPTGSGNDFARGAGIPTEAEASLELLLNPGKITAIDIGLACTKEQSRYFLVSSGIGYDADICKRAMRSPIKKVLNRFGLGKLTYVLVALKLLFLYRPCPVCVRLDQKKTFSLPRFFFVTGMNHKYEGGGVKFCPFADFQDGLLDYCIVGNLSKAKILALFPTAFVGKHTGFRGISMLRGKSLDIISQVPLPVHCDGEILGSTTHLTLTATGKTINLILG